MHCRSLSIENNQIGKAAQLIPFHETLSLVRVVLYTSVVIVALDLLDHSFARENFCV